MLMVAIAAPIRADAATNGTYWIDLNGLRNIEGFRWNGTGTGAQTVQFFDNTGKHYMAMTPHSSPATWGSIPESWGLTGVRYLRLNIPASVNVTSVEISLRNTGQILSFSTIQTTNPVPRPVTPTDFVASNVANGIQLDYAYSGEATILRIYRNGSLVTSRSRLSTNWIDTSAVPGQTYTYGFTAYSDNSLQESLPIERTITRWPNPVKPILQPQNVNHDSFGVTWQALTPPYKVQMGSQEFVVTANSFSFDDLEPDTPYEVTVSYTDTYGREVVSDPLTVTTNPWLPPVYLDLAVTAVTHDTATVNWQQIKPPYKVLLDGVEVEQVSGISYKYAGLQPNTQYTFGVGYTDDFGRYLESEVTATTADLPPMAAAPVISAGNVQPDGLWLQWSHKFASYKVYQDGVQIGTASMGFAPVYDLQQQTQYSFYVVAVDEFGREVQSNTITVTTTAVIPPVPTVTHASVQPSPTNPGKRQLSYTANDGVTAVNVYVDGTLVGTYPVGEDIELDFAGLESMLAKIKVEPTDEDGVPYEFDSPVQSSGAAEVDNFLAKFLSQLGIQRNAFTYIALASIPLMIIVAIFFFLRPRSKKLLLDKDDNKPFGVVNQANPRAINQAQKQGFKVDDTRDERKVYANKRQPRQSKAQQLGFKVVERKESFVPVGFMGSGGYRKKVDITYERNGVEYKQRYMKGQGRVFVPKDTRNQIKHMGNQLQAFKSAFSTKK